MTRYISFCNRIIFMTAFCMFFNIVLSPRLAVGRPERLFKLPNTTFGCGTCHVNPGGGGPRNPFGQDYERIGIPAGDIYTDELANLDSDGDGFTNKQEFDAVPVTHPGDDSSHPPIITINEPPVIVSVGNKPPSQEHQVEVAFPITLKVVAFDPDNDLLSFSAENLPALASFDEANQEFRWTPSATGSFKVTFVVTDGSNQTQETVSITVVDTIPPSLEVTEPSSGIEISHLSIAVAGIASDAAGMGSVNVNGDDASIQADGSFQVTLTFQTNGQKIIEVIAIDVNNNQTKHPIILSIVPKIDKVEPQTGTIGTKVTVEGSGFNTGETVVVDFGDTAGAATVQAASDGTFSATFQVTKQTEGSVLIKATGQSSNTSATDETFIIDTISEILSVKVDGSPATLGKPLVVTLKAEPKGDARFSIEGISAATDVSMNEDPEVPRTYTGSYTPKEGDNVRDATLKVSFTDAFKNPIAEDTSQKVTIDTVAEIQSVTVLITANKKAAKAGDEINLNLVAEPGGIASFTIEGVKEYVELKESLENPGTYEGVYVPKPGQDVKAAIVIGKFTDALGNEASRTAKQSVTIDTIAPEKPEVITDKEIVKNGDIFEITVVAEPGAKVVADISQVDTTQPELVLIPETEKAGVYKATIRVSEENTAQDGIKPITLTVTDIASNPSTDVITIELKQISQFTLNLSKGLNLISMPLKPESEMRLNTLARLIGPDLSFIVFYDAEKGRFDNFSPHFPETSPKNRPIEGGVGYIILMKNATSLNLNGTGWSAPQGGAGVPGGNEFTLNLAQGINLIGVPLNPGKAWKLSHLAAFIGPEVNLIIYYDVTSGKFRSFLPSFPESSPLNIDVVGGMGLIMLMKIPKSVTFRGTDWVGELP